MDELLQKATQGVDPGDPEAFFKVFGNLMGLVPWTTLIVLQVLFVVVGAVLGWWRGRLGATVVASFVLGPLGWVVPFLPRPPATPPPLPGSKKD